MNLKDELEKYRMENGKSSMPATAKGIKENANDDITPKPANSEEKTDNEGEQAKKIGTLEIHQAQAILDKYRLGKSNL